MQMGMNVNVMRMVMVVNNPHLKDLSKNPAVAGFFVLLYLSLYSTMKFDSEINLKMNKTLPIASLII